MTNKERFEINKGYAPSTIGAPVFTNQVDYSVFKKSPEEKKQAVEVVASHRHTLQTVYGIPNYKKHLNIPSKSIGQKIVNTF